MCSLRNPATFVLLRPNKSGRELPGESKGETRRRRLTYVLLLLSGFLFSTSFRKTKQENRNTNVWEGPKYFLERFSEDFVVQRICTQGDMGRGVTIGDLDLFYLWGRFG